MCILSMHAWTSNACAYTFTPFLFSYACRCITKQLSKDELDITEMKNKSQHQKAELQANLDKKKREVELELKEREAKLEGERNRQDIEAKKANQLAQLQVQIEMSKAEYEKAKQLDEKKGDEIKRKLEDEMNALRIREERIRIQAEDKIKQAELFEKKRAGDLKDEFERQEKEQALKYAKEHQDLDLQVKKREAAFKQHANLERLEMEKKFNERAKAAVTLTSASGNTATLKFASDVDATFAALLINATKNPAIQQPQQPVNIALPPPPVVEKQVEPNPEPIEETGQ